MHELHIRWAKSHRKKSHSILHGVANHFSQLPRAKAARHLLHRRRQQDQPNPNARSFLETVTTNKNKRRRDEADQQSSYAFMPFAHPVGWRTEGRSQCIHNRSHPTLHPKYRIFHVGNRSYCCFRQSSTSAQNKIKITLQNNQTTKPATITKQTNKKKQQPANQKRDITGQLCPVWFSGINE